MVWPEFLESLNPQEPTLHLFSASSHDNCEVLAQIDRWTPQEKQYFENAFSRYNNPISQTFFEFVASKFPHKSPEEIKNHYITLFKDIQMENSTNNNDVVFIAANHHRDENHQQHHQVTEEDNSSLNSVPPQVKNSHSRRWQRRIPWNEVEHQLFLMGLNKFGKGDWKSISRYYVVSKTPTQVASHAQKYFCHRNSQTPVDRRRPSINDIQTVTLTPKRKTTSPPKINNNILAYNNNCQVGSSSMPFHYHNYYPFGGPTFTNNSNEILEDTIKVKHLATTHLS